MKKYTIKFLSIGVLFFLFAACDEEPTLTALEPITFPTMLPTSSVDAVVVSADNMDANLISFSWTEVEYPVDAPVTYSLEFALPADTIGASAWENSEVKIIGEDVTTASLTGKELNDIAVKLGIEPAILGTVVVRVRSYLDRATYTKAIAVKITPYKKPVSGLPTLYIAGDFQGWKIDDNPATIVSVNKNAVYEGYLYITGTTLEFKLYAQPDWGPTSYGVGEEDGTIIVHNDVGHNFKAPSAGYYFFMVDLENMTYILIKTDWGIIGGGTPNSWDNSTDMTYDPDKQIWTVTANLTADVFKFRANNNWDIQFGNQDGTLRYADHPWMEYVDLPAFNIPSAGNYTIKLDLHEPGNYTFNMKKN